jgi:hypothetical protein
MSVIVPVALMRGVKVPVVGVVDVAVVWDRHVATALAVLVIVPRVLDVGTWATLVGVVVMGPMQVAVVGVADVVAVWNRHVATALAVAVVVLGVWAMLSGHDFPR